MVIGECLIKWDVSNFTTLDTLWYCVAVSYSCICCVVQEFQAFELLRSGSDRAKYLLVKEAKIIAMTCTHAALKRRDLVDIGFQVKHAITLTYLSALCVCMYTAAHIHAHTQTHTNVHTNTHCTFNEISSGQNMIVYESINGMFT